MAFQYSVNNTPATGSVAIFLLMQNLIAAGWTVLGSSDGTTYNPSGNVITSGSSGAGGFGNADAWFRIQCPVANGATREFTFQHSGASNATLRIKYSMAAGFIGGSPSATETPSAGDQEIILGGGSDSSPTFATALPADGTYRFHTAAGDISVGYGFYYITLTTGTTTTNYSMVMETLQSSTFTSGDPDPTIIYPPNNAGFPPNTYGEWFSWYAPTPTWTTPQLCGIGGAPAFPGGAGSNPNTSKEDGVPIPVVRDSGQSAPFGWKGFLSMSVWAGVTVTNMSTIDTITTGSKDRIYYSNLWLPWNGSNPTI